MNPQDLFSHSYAQARQRFLRAAADAGLAVTSHVHPLRGRDGEELAMDVALDGPPDARRVLMLSSGCHGAEGYAGSGVQVAVLRDAGLRAAARAAGVAILHVHALNPHGFSWWRRVTHENVDLNRNFHDFGKPLPHNAGYELIADLLLPASWPPDDANEARLQAFAATHGERALQQALSGGQYSHPDGLFFGGRSPTWSNLTLRRVLADHGRRWERLGWIDVHTGLGPNGHGEKIFADRNDPLALARARAWWGAEVTSIYDGSSTSAVLQGLMCNAVHDECPQAEYTGIALEYGTVPLAEAFLALRGDHWLALHPQAPDSLRAQIEARARDAFYTDTDDWKARVLEQADRAMRQAIDGLAR